MSLTASCCDLCGKTVEHFSLVYDGLSVDSESLISDRFRSSSSEFAREQVWRCSSCDLVFLSPRQKDSTILQGYSDAHDDDYVSQAETRIRSFKRSVRWIERRIFNNTKQSHRPLRVLDVGAAAGFFLKAAQDHGHIVQGVEPSRWLVEWGKKNLGVQLQEGTLLTVRGLPSAGFDLITMWDVLEHTPSPWRELTRAHQLLREGGWLIINYPDISSRLARLAGQKWWFLLSVHLYYFSPRTLNQYLQKSGFEFVESARHIQTLELGYLVYRAEKYMPRFARFIGKLLKKMRLNRVPIHYYASQRIVIARKPGVRG